MRLLQIDDDAHVAKAFQRIAQSCGYEVRSTDRSDIFKATYESFQPQVIILDLAMPEVDGVEILRFLADAACQASILIFSGLEPRVLEAAGRLAGARGLKIAGVLSKPVRAANLRLILNGLKEAIAVDA
jgi:DNA-binding response OmpR family regulator